jgi:hypothetical protein
MRGRLLLFILFICSVVSGQNLVNPFINNGVPWYVSNSGSSLNDGRTPATPIDVATLYTKTIDNGDAIYFNRGETYHIGNWRLNDPNDAVVISPYGSGADPAWDGSEDISVLTWTALGGDVYSTPMATNPGWIWINDLCAKNAETARVTISSRGSTTLITVPNGTLDVYTDITNAWLVAKEKNFQQSYRRTITNFNKTTDVITLDSAIDMTSNLDLVVYNDTEFLSGNNQWVWDGTTLYVRAAASPSTMNIRKSSFNYGLHTRSDVDIDNIEFKNYYVTALWSYDGVVNVDQGNFHDNRDCAILYEHKVTGQQVINSTFSRNGNNAITMRGSDNAVVTDNTFADTGMQENYGWQIWVGDKTYTMSVGCDLAFVVDQSANTVDGTGLVFDRNVSTNVAYCTILMGLGTDSFIRQNRISDFMNRFNDGGAIYTFHFRATNIPNDNTEISNNIIDNNNGNATGMGIYCDNRTFAANVHHNTVKNVTGGAWAILFNFDTSDHTCEYNNTYNASYGVVYRQNNPSGFLYNTNANNDFNFNNIGALTGSQVPLYFKLNYSNPSWNPFSGTGSADNNRYVKSTRLFNVAESDNHGGLLNLSQLQTAYGEDAASTFQFEIPFLVTNATASTSSENANSDYMDLDGNTLTTYNIDPYYSRLIVEKDYSNTFVAASSQYFDIGTTADIQFTDVSAFSIAFWFKIPSNPASIQRILTNQNAGTSRGISIDILTTGAFEIRFTNTTATNRMIWRTVNDWADNAWHHCLIAAPSTKTSTKIYIDGTADETLNNNNLSATIASTDVWRLGAGPTPSIYVDATIDDLAIWNSSMVGNQVALYNGGVVHDYRDTFPPLHYWKLGVSSDLVDLGTSATDLTLTPVNSPASSTDIP